MTEKIYIIDLDETLLSVNSYPYFAKYFLRGSFPNLSVIGLAVLRIKALRILLEREILKHSHAHTKNRLQKLWAKSPDAKAMENLLVKLESKIRPEFFTLIEKIKSGEVTAILASAAAEIYVRPLAEKIGFKNCIATKIDGAENKEGEKKRSVLECIEKNGWQSHKKIFFTDHLEDMPLMLASDQVFWFGKEDEIAVIKSARADLDIIIWKNHQLVMPA